MGNETQKPVVLITGSSGLIGSKLVEAFPSDYAVIGMDQKRPTHAPAGTRFLECDLTDRASVQESLSAVREQAGSELASVLHLAAYYDFSGEPSPLYHDLTLGGTEHLLDALRDFRVEQFVFSSSLLVMKPAEEGERLEESSPTEASWDYPRSKLEAEELIREQHRDIPAVLLRIAGVYTEECESIPIAQQIRRIYEKSFESYFFPGDPDHGQAFVHMDDLVACFRRVVERRKQLTRDEVFLIAEPDVMSYAELQDVLGALIHGKEWPTIVVPKPIAKAGAWVQVKLKSGKGAFIKPWMIDLADAQYAVDIKHAQDRLGWNPVRRLRDTLGEMVRRLKDDPKGWYAKNKLPFPEEKASAA
jgi:nucleoside-diphosphate-sugar epimerase